MKKLLAVSSIVGGILLAAVPRYLLPACEYEGFTRMHCSDTARAELITALLLIGAGIALSRTKTKKALIAGGMGALALSVAAFMLPEIFGYCHSAKMPCNYGMVPGIRFIALLTSVVVVVALIGIVKESRRKGTA